MQFVTSIRDYEKVRIGHTGVFVQLAWSTAMSANDKSSPSESSTMFRKEDTFIVTEKDINNIFPSDDLRRRKAMALAKANARHAIKVESSRNYSHRQSKTPKMFTNQRNGYSGHRSNRVYIEGTGPELKSRRGEQIYFQWKETDSSSRQQSSRTLPYVRKLYEYKRQKLKSKPSESWKSAPHKKSISNKVLSKREASLKRSKTSLTTANERETSSVLSAFSRLSMRVAFADNGNTALENSDVNSECHLTRTGDHNQENTRYPLSVIPETCKDTLRKDIIHSGKNSSQPIENSIINVVNSSESPSSANISPNVDVHTRLSFVAPVVSLATDVKDSPKVPCESTNKILHEPKINNPINDIQHSKDASQHVQNVPVSNSFLQARAMVAGGPEVKSEIEQRSVTTNSTSEASSQSDNTSINVSKTSRNDDHVGDRDNTITEKLYDRYKIITGYTTGSDTLEPVNDRSLGGQENVGNINSLTQISTAGSNSNTRNKKEHATRASNDSEAWQAQHGDNGSAESDVIAKSNINIEQENGKSTEKIRVSDDSVNGIDVIKSKGYISERKYSYGNRVIKNINLCRNCNDQSIKLSISGGLNLIRTSVNSTQENTNKNIHTNSPVYDSGKVSRSEKEISADLKGASVKPTSKGKSGDEDGGSKMSVHKHIRTRAKLAGGDQTHVINPDQTHKTVIVSSNRIDHRFVNKPSRKGKGLGTLQFERTVVEQGSQSCVTEQNRGAAMVASQALKTSQRDAEVSMATSQRNTNITTGGQRRKPGLGMKDSLCLLPASVNNLDHNETCHSELKHNDPPLTPSNAGKKHFDSQVVRVCGALQGQSSSDIFPASNAGDLVVTDKHCHNMNYGCQSITDGLSNDALNLDLLDINEGDETKSTSFSINRLKTTCNLALGELHPSGGVQKKGNAVSYDVSSRKSKTLRSPKNKVRNTDFGSRQDTKENFQHISKRNRNRLQINVAVSANNMFTVQNMRGHCDSREEESIADHESISGSKIIYDDFHAVAISAAVVRACRTQAGGGNDQITTATITCGDENRDNKHLCDSIVSKTLKNSVNGDITDNIRQPADNVCSVIDDSRNTVFGNSQLNGQAGKNNSQINYSKPVTTKTIDEVDDKDKRSIHNSTSTRKGSERKRQTLSLHTQKMEFRDLPKENVTKTNIPQQVHVKGNIALENKASKPPASFIASQKSVALQDIQDVKDMKNSVSNSEKVSEDTSRPKTAGLSAYATHRQPDDLWSVNTGDDYDDDDEDDQIQFIDGEQDFYKVFGYNEETAAILSATKVYPVQDCVVAVVTSVEQSAYSSKRTKELYVGSKGSGTLANSYVCNTFVNENSSDNKTLINRNISKGDVHVQRNETLLKQTDHNKMSKKNSNSLGLTDKSFTKNTPDDYKPTTVSNQGYVNINKKLSKSHLDSTSVHVTEADPVVSNQSIVQNVFTKDGRQIERSSPNEQRSDIFLPSRSNNKPHEHELTDLKKLEPITGPHKVPTLSIADAISSDSTPSVGTLANGVHSLGQTHKKGRRRIHSDADIPTNNNIPAPISDWHSERNMTSQNEHVLSPREANVLGNKDSKSYVALRNQLATEKHINHTRYHRHVNNGINTLHKNNPLHISVVNDKMTLSTTKDGSDNRHGTRNETVKPPHFRSKDNTSQLDHTSRNSYLNAADRILSRISDTENLIHTRSEVYNSTVPQDKFPHRGPDTHQLNSPLRRMSHPVDTRIKTTQSGSYFAARPRKLKPILQLPEVKSDQK